MISMIFAFFLTGSCDFQSAYNKALEDDESGSYGLNIDRHCPGASREDIKKFRSHYETVREKAKVIREKGIDEAPKSAKDLNLILENRDLINQKVEAQTDYGAAEKKQELLAERIKTLEAENLQLREEIRKLKGQSKE